MIHIPPAVRVRPHRYAPRHELAGLAGAGSL
ncbi:hypothetical protein J2R78_001442 [Bradyrhizobium sp. USDA 4538]|nr:hypothetical protein [Bradyrhizobium sp. USDA 4538]MCP1899039.1 hypothetical protein [Bradyrhizobium sp. USDA 4537]MCP1986848.1 hypothetical protein [Bradyrhizobium sp. USDA 4539]